MPALRPCLRCGGLHRRPSGYCDGCERPAWEQRSPSSRETARPGWNRLRALALQRDGHACVRCGATEQLAVHHVLPVADGGRTVLSNLVTLCATCHRIAHHA